MSFRAVLRVSVLGLAIATVVFAATEGTRTATPALAFNSTPWGPHDQITKKAAEDAGFNPKASEALQDAVKQPDFDETKLTFGGLKPNKKYKPDHHCDRGHKVDPKTGMKPTAAEAFEATAAYIRAEKLAATNLAKAGKKKAAIAALGRALHALQDCKSHSNYVDLTPDEKAEYEEALMDGTKKPPAKLKITGYDPDAKTPGKPKGDAYAHDDFSKDSAGKNAEAKKKIGGKTKYELAKAAAIEESTALLKMVKTAVPVAQWDNLREWALAPDPSDDQYAWAGSAECVPDGCVVSSHGTTVLFPPGVFGEPETVAVLGVPPNFFASPDMITAPDGAQILIYREVRPGDREFDPPAEATVNFSPMEVVALEIDSLAVYFSDPVSSDWVPISSSIVDAWSGIATFPVAKGGLYGIGGQPKLSDADIEVSPSEIRVSFGGDPVGETVLGIENLGDTDLTWSLSLDPVVHWLSVAPGSGTVAAGETEFAVITFATSGLPWGLHVTALRLTSNDPGEPLVIVPVMLQVEVVSPGFEKLVNGQAVGGTVVVAENHEYVIELPDGQETLSVTLSGSGDADLYVKYGSPILEVELNNVRDEPTFKAPYTGGTEEIVSFAIPPSGLWYVTVRGFNPSSEYSLVATWNEAAADRPLESGQAFTDTILKDEVHVYVIELPQGVEELKVAIQGDGDADLYVKFGARVSSNELGEIHDEPTFKAPYVFGSDEIVSFVDPPAGAWYVTVRGFDPSSDYSLIATWSEAVEDRALESGQAVMDTVLKDEVNVYVFEMPQGVEGLTVALQGDGDADLYVKFGAPVLMNELGEIHDEPTFKAPYVFGSDEIVSFVDPPAGAWYVTVRGFDPTSDYSVVAVWQ